MIVVPTTQLVDQLSDIIAGRLDGGSLRLYQNDYVPTANSQASDFTVCNFTGYSNQTVATWGTPFADVNGIATTLAPMHTFAASGSTTSNLAYGMYYLDAGGALVYAERFDSPFNFAAAGDSLPMVPRYQLNP